MRTSSLPKVIIIDLDSLNAFSEYKGAVHTTEQSELSAAMVAAVKEPINEIGVI